MLKETVSYFRIDTKEAEVQSKNVISKLEAPEKAEEKEEIQTSSQEVVSKDIGVDLNMFTEKNGDEEYEKF